jgi:hypothetical protein
VVVRGIRCLPLVAISIVLAGCASSGKRAAPIAAPQRVVAAYFAAGNAHDKARARPLVTPGFARFSFNPHDGWFNGAVKVTHLETTRPRYTHNAYGYEAHVGTSYVFEQLSPGHGSNAVSGEYCLYRKGPHDAWRIGAEGNC